MKFFELYIGGKHGFSFYVKTNKTADTEEVVHLAIDAGLISTPDAGDIIRGEEDSYCQEVTQHDIELAGFIPSNLREI